jgi:hypothetical protein
VTTFSLAHTSCLKMATPERLKRERGHKATVISARMEEEGVVYTPVDLGSNLAAFRQTYQESIGGGGVGVGVARAVVKLRQKSSVEDELLEWSYLPAAFLDLRRQDPQVRHHIA